MTEESMLNFYCDSVKKLLDEAGDFIAKERNRLSLVDFKKDRSVVTVLDVAVENKLREYVSKQFPEHGIIGEELADKFAISPYQWVFDPIDGTAEFVRGLPFWGTIVSLLYNGEPIVAGISFPDLGKRIVAYGQNGVTVDGASFVMNQSQIGPLRIGLGWRGSYLRDSDETAVFDGLLRDYEQHMTINSCYGHMLALWNGVDVAVSWNANLWDVIATKLIIEESGGSFVFLKTGKEVGDKKLYSAVFGKPDAVKQVCNSVKSYLK